jgi:hypothetical protein
MWMSYQSQGFDDAFSGVIWVGNSGAGTYAKGSFPAVESLILLIWGFDGQNSMADKEEEWK